MSTPIVTKLIFTITFPAADGRTHIHHLKLHSLARKQLSDTEVIDTIDHLFKCSRCFEQYRFILTSYQASV